jgi:RHS repeat-associated protein
MLMIRSIRVVTLLFLFNFAVVQLHAQVPTGTPPFGSFGGGPDVIDLANMNVHLDIPVLNKPGRGTNFTYDLSYDSSVWYPAGSSGSQTWQPVANWGGRGQTEAATGYVSYSTRIIICIIIHQVTQTTGFYNFVYHDPFGVSHPFNMPTLDSCPGYVESAYAGAVDDSGYLLYAVDEGSWASPEVWSSKGTFFYPPHQVGSGSGSYTDRNGNEITVSSSGQFYDTLSSTIPVLTVAGSGTPSSPRTFTYTAASGTSPYYTVNYTNYTVATNFGVSGISEYTSSAAVPLVSSIALPDGSQYSFTYEATPGSCTPYSGTTCVTARLKTVTLPTGGTITYVYTGGSNGILSDGSAATLSRQTPDGTWTYAQVKGTGAASTTTINDPQGNQTVIQFQGIYETQRQVYQGSTGGTLLQTINTCYNGAASPCTGTAVTLPILQRNAITSVPSTGSSTLQAESAVTYNGNGVPTELDNYAFGSGAVGAPLRKTTITYATLGNITAFPQQVTVQNGSGAALAQTVYNYDQTTPAAAPSGTPQLTSVSGSRGNLTSVQLCTNPGTCTSYVQTTMTYDTAGQVRTVTDPLNNQTGFSYTDNFYDDNGATPPASHAALGYPTDAYVTTVTLPASGSLQYGYYYYSGQLAVSTDQNSNSSYNHFQDSLLRLTSAYAPSVPLPAGGSAAPWVLNTYASETQADTYTGILDTSPSSSCSICRHDQALLDGLGRSLHSYLKSDPEGQTEVDTAYDTDGRVQTVSHPYRSTSDGTYGLETPAYDALNRVVKVTHPDSTFSQTLYGSAIGSNGLATQGCSTSTYGIGYPVLFIDESGRKRQTWTDALGRTIEGDEPDSSGNLTSHTCYSYDALGDLLQIVHGSQTRTYAYDPLSRVTSVTIPETSNSSGSNCSVTFTYDSNSNVKTRVAPTPNQTSCTTTVTTTYSYDALNRLTKISYSDGTTPTVQYGFDGNSLSGCSTPPPSLTDPAPKGRRTSMCDGSGATSWAHDAAGRIATESRTISGINKTISYAYNLDSTIASVTYPSGKTITYTVSNAQRLTAAKDNTSGTQFVYGASYAPPGGLSGLIAGQVSGGFSGITESHTYNSSLEYTSTAASSSSGTALNLALNYNLPGGDNGTVTSITNNVDTGRTQTVTYDPLNRVLSAASSATSGVDCWGQVFGPDGKAADDAVANLTNINSGTQTQPTCPFGLLSVTVDGNNHLNSSPSFAYDAAGNMTNDGSGLTYTFDAENRLTLASGMTGGPYCYVYDGNGLRVAKETTTSTCSSGTTVAKIYWRSLSGDALAETDGTGSTTNSNYNEYVFFAGRRVGSRNGSGGIFYWFADGLGTTRSITTGNGPGQTSGQLCYDVDFTPYGQEMSHTEHLQTTACPPNYKFTGYERDTETGLDYAFARYYSSSLGRFLSTDPLGGSIGSLQSHNAYAYVMNNPSNLVDPTGQLLMAPGSGNAPGSNPFDPTGNGSLWSSALNGNLVPVFTSIGVAVPAYPCEYGDCVVSPPWIEKSIMILAGWAYYGWPTQNTRGSGNSSGFTLGIRAPGQTFNQCMVQNAANYSAGGAFDLAAGTSIGNSTAGQILAGNTFTGLYSALAGSPGDAATVAGTAAPDLLNSAMGSTLTFGRRTSNILSLNLAGKGGLPQALSSSSGGLKSLLGSASKALNLGLDASLKAAGDLGLFGAEIIGCSVHR